MNGSDRQTPRAAASGSGVVTEEKIPLFKVHMPPAVLGPLSETLLSGYIGQGPRVAEFEAALAPWFGRSHVLAVNSGTSAIHLALRLAGVGQGDEVISTPMTCAATNQPVLVFGARIVWADIDASTGTIDPPDVERKITSRTRAIIAVHLGGYPCDLDELGAIAASHGILLIEDAAHAFGAFYRGQPIGSHSDYVCFSFQAIKHLTTVDGGALTCRSDESYRRGKLLRWFGIDREANDQDFRCGNDVIEYGYKFHMNDVGATIGLEQLRHVGAVIAAHRRNAAYYDEALYGVPGLALPNYRKDRVSSYWLYTILVEHRQEFMKRMLQDGVEVSQVHGRNDRHATMRDFHVELPNVTSFASRMVCIPVGWWLTEAERRYVADAVRRHCEFLQREYA